MKIKRDSLDILFSQYVMLRDKYCQRCGGNGGLQTAHFIGRARKSVRWDDKNSCLLCFGCHGYFHAHPLEFVEWYRNRIGEKELELLQARARVTWPKPDKEMIKLWLQNEIKDLEKE